MRSTSSRKSTRRLSNPTEDTKQKLIGEMLAFLDKTGQKSAKTAKGTVTVIVPPAHRRLTDPDQFIDFVFKNDLLS